jgi:hypothetical protein
MRHVEPLKAVVREGRLVLDVPTDLPEGTVVELVVVDDADTELLEELETSERDEAAGDLVDFDAVLARLASKPQEVVARLASPEEQARLEVLARAARDRAVAIVEGAHVGPEFLARRVTI